MGGGPLGGLDDHPLFHNMGIKIKGFSEALVERFKARFCVYGNHQKEGVDHF